MWYGIGNTGMSNPAGAFVQVLNDGSVILSTGCADIGQGSDTVLAQIVAEQLGFPVAKVKVISADTGVTPDAGATSASRQTYISGNAVKRAAESAGRILYDKAAGMLGVTGDALWLEDDIFRLKTGGDKTVALKDVLAKCRMEGVVVLGSGTFNPETTGLDPETGQGDPYATYAYATQWVEVEVDTGTGEVRILKVVAAHDVGKAINPLAVEGQIEGGCMMGLGYALMEEVIVTGGAIINPRLSSYLIPTSCDAPEYETIIVEESEQTGPFGAKGVGEPALIPTAPAVANAISNALGIRFYDLPITPEKILTAIKEADSYNDI